MRGFSSTCVFDYSWDEVSTANWHKYCPWNDKSTHVIAVDTLSRDVDASSGILRTERLITCKQSAPAWIQTLLGASEYSYVHETSYVDPLRKSVTMVSSNITWSNFLNVRETVVYEPARIAAPGSLMRDVGSTTSSSSAAEHGAGTTALSQERTQFQQEAKIIALCGGWQKVRTKIEEASVERFAENATKGREGFEAVLRMSRRVFGEERERAREQHMA